MSTDDNSQYPQRSAKEPMSPFVQADQVMALYIPYIRVKLNKGEFGEGLCRFTKGKRWLFFQNAVLEHIGHTCIFEATAEGGYVYRTTVKCERIAVDSCGGGHFAILQKCDERNVHYLQVFSFDDMQATWKVEFSTHVETGDLKKGLFFASGGDELFGLDRGDLVYQISPGGQFTTFRTLRRAKQNAYRSAWYFPQRPSGQNQIGAINVKLGVNMRVPEEQGKEEKKNTIPLLGDGVAFSANADYLAAQVIGKHVSLYKKDGNTFVTVGKFEGDGVGENDYGFFVDFPAECQLEVHSWMSDGSGRRFKYIYTEVADDQWELSSKAIIEPIPVKPYVQPQGEPGVEQEVASKVDTPTLTKEEKVFLDYIIEQEKRAMEQAAYYRELKKGVIEQEKLTMGQLAYYTDLKNKILSKK